MGADGSLASGSDNISSILRADERYEIRIEGQIYDVDDYATLVTTISPDSRTATTAATTSGRLVVSIFDTSGTLTQDNFSFVVFGP